MEKRRRRLPGSEAADIMNQHKHRGYDDWIVTKDFKIYSKEHNQQQGEFILDIWEARAIAYNYLYFVEKGWIKETDFIDFTDRTDAPEA